MTTADDRQRPPASAGARRRRRPGGASWDGVGGRVSVILGVVPDDPATHGAGPPAAQAVTAARRPRPPRRRASAMAGHRGDARRPAGARRPRRLGTCRRPRGPGPHPATLGGDDVLAALADPDARVRRRAAEASARARAAGARARPCPRALRRALDGPRPPRGRGRLLGPRRTRATPGRSAPLAAAARRPRRHPLPRGGGGRPRGHRRPGRGCRPCSPPSTTSPPSGAGRRWRWPPSTDPRSTPALRRCLADRDWQVRQAAEILLEGAEVHRGPGPAAAGPVPALGTARRPRLSGRRRRRPAAAGRRTRGTGPAPSTTHSSGVSTRWTGTAVPSARRWLMPRSSAPPPTRWIPSKMMSWASSGGASPEAVGGGVDDLGHVVLQGAADLVRA